MRTSTRRTTALLLAAATLPWLAACGQEEAPGDVTPRIVRTATTTAMSAAPATSVTTATSATRATSASTGLPSDGCIERDAQGQPIWRGSTGLGGERVRRALAALNTDPGKEIAGGAICSDGRHYLVASPTYAERRVVDGDVQVPLPKPLYRLVDGQSALLTRFHANSIGFDVTRAAYVVGGEWERVPADTVVDGVPVHFERRGPATAMNAPATSAPSSAPSAAPSTTG